VLAYGVICRSAGWARDSAVWNRDHQSGFGAKLGPVFRRRGAQRQRHLRAGNSAVSLRPGARCLRHVPAAGTRLWPGRRESPRRRMHPSVPIRPGARSIRLVPAAGTSLWPRRRASPRRRMHPAVSLWPGAQSRRHLRAAAVRKGEGDGCNSSRRPLMTCQSVRWSAWLA